MVAKRTKEEEAQLNKEYAERSERLRAIIKPLRESIYQTDIHWSSIDSMFASWTEDHGPIELDPDFQRGHVWHDDQRLHFLENVLRGVVSASAFIIQLNCPNWNNFYYKGELPKGFQCIDGLQRLTTVMKFMKGEIKPFGLTIADLERSSFMIKNRYRFVFQIFDFGTRSELLQHYLDLNAGGTPHSPEEIARVRALRDAAITKP